MDRTAAPTTNLGQPEDFPPPGASKTIGTGISRSDDRPRRSRSAMAWALVAGIFALFVAWALGARAQSSFPSETVGTPSAPQNVSVTVPAGGTVAQVQVLTAGAANLDFAATGASTCAGTLASDAVCIQPVTFTPSAPGIRMGAVVVLGSSEVLGVTYIYGTGNGGLGVLVPANVMTMAGISRTWTSTEDGLAADQANLNLPAAVVLDGSGNMYIADSGNNKVRMVAAPASPVSLISTYVGTGVAGYTGDNAAAKAATLSSPGGLALDGAGNLYISDTGNNVIRKVTAATGIITTVAGTGPPAKPGFGGDNGPAVAANLNTPWGITVDKNGNLYIADTGNQRIRRVDAVTGVITTVAGNGNPSGKGDGKGTFGGDGGPATLAGLSLPWAVAFDAASNNMYIADSANNCVRMVTPGTPGTISTYAGVPPPGTPGYYGDGGLATLAELNTPSGVAVDAAGDVYIADTQNAAIRKVNALTGIISTAAINGFGTDMDPDGGLAPANLYAPYGIAIDSIGNIYFADYFDMLVGQIQANFTVIDYTNTPVRQGDKSAPHSPLQQVENDGNVPLDLTQLQAGANTAFDDATTTCAAGSPYLPVHLECNIGAVFAPTISGNPLRGDLDIDIAAVGTPLDIALIGNATPVNSTTVVVTSNNNPSNFSQGVTFTAAVTTGAGTGNLTGTVTFTDGTATLATGVPLNAADSAAFTITTLSVGSHSITASYSGDAGHFASTSRPALIQVVNEATAVTLVSSANPSSVGTLVTFTAVVTTPNGGGAVPDGNIVFYDGTTILGSNTVGAGVQATYTTSALAAGPHAITAVYGGDAAKNILGSTSAVLNQDVQANSSMAVTSNPNPSNYGVPVTFTATVTAVGPVATGAVKFLDGGQQIGIANLAGSPGTAAFTISTLGVGNHSITAVYGGDAYNGPSTSAAITQTVAQDPTAVAEAAAPNPGIAGAPVAITATVKVTTGASTPTGTISFTDGTTSLGNSPLGTGAAATIHPTLTPGSHSIVATYAGDVDDGGSVSAPLSLTVQLATTATTVTSAPNPAIVQSAITFTAKVTGNGEIPTGAVSFVADGTTIGTANLDATGTATVTYSGLAVGSHSITATYVGDANDSPSTSSAITQVVGTIPTVTDLGSSATSGSTPQLILVAAVLGGGGPTPTGTVTFSSGSTVIGSASLDSSGVATLTPNLATANYTIAASYGGDALHGPSTSQPLVVSNPSSGFTITVTPPSVTMATSQNATVNVNLSSVAGFSDTVGLGCGSLPGGVTCHFSELSAQLASSSNASVQLTIDTNNPLGGGTSAMNTTPGKGGAALAGLFLPFTVLFGLSFWRFRKRNAAVFTALLVLLISGGAILISGCSGYSQSTATPGTYTIQVIGVGANSNLTHYQNVTLTITH